LALSVTDPHVDDRRTAFALHHAAVLMLEDRNPVRLTPFKHGRNDGMWRERRLDKDHAAGAAVLRIGDATPILDLTIHIQD
jgi:hypothetical protein